MLFRSKLEKGKEKRKTGGAVGLYKYLARAAKALVVTETTIENSTVQYETVYAVILPPPSEKLALKLYIILVTQLIKAQAQQERCRQACTIGLSINEIQS